MTTPESERLGANVNILYMNLRIVGVLLRERILDKVGDFAKEDADEKLFNYMRQKGIYLSRCRVQKSKDVDTFQNSIAKHSFNGSECAIMLAIWPHCLEIIHPEHKRMTDPAAAEQYACS